jgi:hypothetical protein
MKPNLFFCAIIGVFIIGCLASCKDIIEPDISKKAVQLQAPGANYKSASYNINFWWEGVDDALTYHLQVVSPKFDSIGSLVLDTTLKTTKFSINLSPGNYEWRVRAENGSYKTAYSAARGFTVLQSSIKNQKVQLLGPANNALTNQATATFSWGDLYGATKYRLQIDTNNFINETLAVYNQVTPNLQMNFTFAKDQTYQWRVRAENDTAQAQWSAINSINYDHTPPAKVSLVTPTNNQTVTLPATLQWNTVLTAAKYKLYILKSDSTTLYNSTFPLTTTNTSYSFNMGSFGEKVYWKVAAIDAAGNEGALSDLRNFVHQ